MIIHSRNLKIVSMPIQKPSKVSGVYVIKTLHDSKGNPYRDYMNEFTSSKLLI
jgi:hypothetical protein